jgi:Terminase small subunit
MYDIAMSSLPTDITPRAAEPLPAPLLTSQQEAFAMHYAAFGDPAGAYLHAYHVTTTRRASVQSMGYKTLRHPKVAARIRALRNAAAANDEATSAARLIADLEAIAYADSDEIMRLAVVNCRWCWGTGHAYQFRDDRELADACGKALAEHRPLPDMAGGVGFRGDREPYADCPRCDGHGVAVPRFSDTSDASPAARALIKGLELHADGSVKRVVLHDQMAIRTELHRLKGMHVDRSVSLNVNANVPALKSMTADEAAAFLDRLLPQPVEALPDLTVVSIQP